MRLLVLHGVVSWTRALAMGHTVRIDELIGEPIDEPIDYYATVAMAEIHTAPHTDRDSASD